MSLANNIRVRAALNELTELVNTRTSSSPVVIRGNAFAVQVGVFDRTVLADLAGHATAKLQLMSASRDGGAPRPGDPDPVLLYWDEDSAVNNTLTLQQWREGTGQHLSFTIDAERSAVPTGIWWLVCYLQTEQGKITLFAGRVDVVNDGTDAGNIEAPEPLAVLRDAAIDAADRAGEEADRAEVAREQIEHIAGALLCRGTWSTPAYPPIASPEEPDGAAVGDLWVISASVTIEGVNFVAWDVILYSGAGWQSVPLTAVMTALSGELDALRREVNRALPARGGVFFEQTGYARIDDVTPAALSVGGFTLSWCGKVTARGEGFWNCLLGNNRGISSHNIGAVGLAVGNVSAQGRAIFIADTGTTSTRQIIAPPNTPSLMDRVVHLAGVYDHSTKEASLYIDGVLVGTSDWTDAPLNSTLPMYVMQAVTGNGVVDWQRSPAGDTYHAAILDRALTPVEVAELASGGGQIVPLSARAALLVDLAMDEGNGYQLRDRSGNGNHALLTATDFAHLIPSSRFEFVWTRVSSGFLGDADRPVLPEGAVIESIIWEDTKGTKTTASLGYNASNPDTHVASFTPAQSRQHATLAAGSMAAADRRLYLHMGANAGAVIVRVSGRSL